MNNDLRERLLGMISVVNPTQQQIDNLIAGWEHYFRVMDIPPAKQEEEFGGILRIRLFSGSISLVTPDLNELFGGGEE